MENNKKALNIGKYILKFPNIGEGCFGKVFICKDMTNQRIYAAKMVDIQRIEEKPERKEKFIRELKISAKMNHPNIVKIYDIKRTEHNFYLILEFCDGGNLQKLLDVFVNKFSLLPSVKLIQHFTRQIVNGLYYMNKNKSVHRDIKLENIMLCFDNFEYETIINNEKPIDSGSEKYSKNNLNVLKVDKSLFLQELLQNESHSNINKDNLEALIKNDFINDGNNRKDGNDGNGDKNGKNDKNESVNGKNDKNNSVNDRKDGNGKNDSIKSNNNIEQILLNSTIKIVDLGLARELNEEGKQISICGTPLTIAPEIWDIQFGDSFPKRITYYDKLDAWSLGCIVFTLLTGSPPFLSNDYFSLHQKLKEGKYSYSRNLTLVPEIIDFIDGLLQYKPEERLTWDEIIEHPFIKRNVSEFGIYDNCGEIEDCVMNVNKREKLLETMYKSAVCNSDNNGSSGNTHVEKREKQNISVTQIDCDTKLEIENKCVLSDSRIDDLFDIIEIEIEVNDTEEDDGFVLIKYTEVFTNRHI